MIQLLLERYINIFFFQFKISHLEKRTSTSSWKWKGSFRSTNVERKVSLTKYPETNFQPPQATRQFHNFWTYSVMHRVIFRNLILRYEIPGDQMTYLEPRLLTIKDVAVKDTRSGRSDRTTNIRCSSLHAFSHSPVEEIDREIEKGKTLRVQQIPKRLSKFHN